MFYLENINSGTPTQHSSCSTWRSGNTSPQHWHDGRNGARHVHLAPTLYTGGKAFNESIQGFKNAGASTSTSAAKNIPWAKTLANPKVGTAVTSAVLDSVKGMGGTVGGVFDIITGAKGKDGARIAKGAID